MPTRVIPRQSWGEFLESFSRQHHGWLITIASKDQQGRNLVQLDKEPLDEIQFDGEIIAIRSQDKTHRIEAPTEISAEQREDGVISALRIANRGGKTEIRFRTVIAPELVDGMLL